MRLPANGSKKEQNMYLCSEAKLRFIRKQGVPFEKWLKTNELFDCVSAQDLVCSLKIGMEVLGTYMSQKS